MKKDIADSITIDDFDRDSVYYILAEKIGVKNTLEIAEIFQGSCVYFPKLDNVYARKIREKIISEFNGYNYKYLAMKYGYSEMWIRKMVKDDSSDVIDGQISFDDLEDT